ncbi:MAG: helix-turn-helix domain-containing protein, partial [Steroidobacteraceae bacterium]
AEGIGARLRSARQRSRLTILQAAEKLHVDPDVLEALEADDFAALGAPVYVKGHLRHYAELVGEPVQSLFDLYSHGTRISAPDLTRIPKPVPDGGGRLVGPAILMVIGFALAGILWLGLSLSHRQWLRTPSRPMPITVSAATPVLPVSERQAAAVMPVVASVAAASAQIDAVFTYSADSWTEVSDATGRRLLYGMSTGPATRKLDGVPPLNVMLGNASDVTIEVGGRAASISRFVRPDHTARFLIAADGRLLAAPRKNGG